MKQTFLCIVSLFILKIEAGAGFTRFARFSGEETSVHPRFPLILFILTILKILEILLHLGNPAHLLEILLMRFYIPRPVWGFENGEFDKN